MRFTKDDVERSYHQGHSGEPMVNVKVYDSLADGFRKFLENETPEDGFNLEWIEENVSDDHLEGVFWRVCESGWEQLQSDAEDIFGPSAKVYSAGRSGGWAVVEGLPDVDEWDAIFLAKWHKFERWTRDAANYIMAGVVESVWINEYEWQLQEAIERERAANQDVATA
jgi:hypothetical protein